MYQLGFFRERVVPLATRVAYFFSDLFNKNWLKTKIGYLDG